ncbi:hypothetical protein BGZ61DRAFT_496109 [Ilyonectria robusta]|uniref:uncharacterized protein n=1 Tax=Ilyonectria robusta TaxID=1079257 RepID=UPI001E8D6771|nr:uncharacterized protein BGZ61DRAFT_496109 [Ilyonectria robusta]KAH8683780.1 hypothetical protein BGZ61DRAFT_496109 [Ilyonectria robusta]
MAMAGDGPWAVAVMWSLTVMVLIFVILRIYARMILVKAFGTDDFVFILAFVCLLLFTIFINISAMYGFGQNTFDIHNAHNISKAVLFECISQTFNVLGMALAKWSLGLFLLRLVQQTWHKVAIWAALWFLMGASISCLLCFWFQCSPPAYLWDRTLLGGKCELNILPVSIILGATCILVDFFFAIFPWIFMWKLQMNQREKLVILGSMSLGSIAGVCGIKRATEIPGLLSKNYLKDSVGIIVWSAAEMAVTMVCIGIPVCRPLYKKYLGKWSSKDGSKYNANTAGGYRLRTIGTNEMHDEIRAESVDSCAKDGQHIVRVDKDLDLHNSNIKSSAIRGGFPGDNQSEEEILGIHS